MTEQYIDIIVNNVVRGRKLDSGEEVLPLGHISYQTIFTSEEWILLLTREEMKAFIASSNETIADTYALFMSRNGEVDVKSEVFNAVMTAAVSDGTLTQGRVAELKLGVRI
jgi:hypothetical protein